MNQKILIPSQYITGYIETDKLDLTNLPELEISNSDLTAGKPVCMGFVTFYKPVDGYGFIVTYGEQLSSADQARPVQEIYFKKKDWESESSVSVGRCVTFTIGGSKSRPQAYNVCPISCTHEIYSMGKLHIGNYASIKGTTRSDSARYYFQKAIHNLFLSTEEGKNIVLQNIFADLQSQKEAGPNVLLDYIERDARIEQLLAESLPKLNSPEEKEIVETLYLAQLSKSLYDYDVTGFQEKLSLLTFDKCKAVFWNFVNQKMLTDSEKCQRFLSDAFLPETLISYLSYSEYHPNASVRIYLTTLTKTTDWIKHPSVVSELNKLASESYVSLLNIWNRVLSLGKQQENELACYIAESSIATDKLKWYVFLISGIDLCFTRLKEKHLFIESVHTLSPEIICKFLLSIQQLLDEEEFCETLLLLGNDTIATGIKLMDDDRQYQFVSDLPVEIGLEIVSKSFKQTDLFTHYVKDRWDICKAEVPYMVFDIESDGNSIREFAILKDNNIRPYQSEEQLNALGRAIKNTPIVVGHNIRQWDLPILEKKGYSTESFVWDTLEIEILLNPCRYAYSLQSTHNADDDVELTNNLFWNQLYRLSLQPELCDSLKEFLPKELNSILGTLQLPVYKEFFEETAMLQTRFFQELRPLSEELKGELTSIAHIPTDERTLIVAPNNLWPRIAQVVPLQFPKRMTDNEFMSIDADKVRSLPISELKNRLDILFTKLGLSKIAHQLHVYTFHALAKKCMGQLLNNIPTDQWESEFLKYLNNNVAEFKVLFPQIEIVLVDEFQDITQTRLDSLLRIHKIYRKAKFFTIGDINQSIYGFDRVPKDVSLTPEEYAEKLNPQPYYEQLKKELKPVQLTMSTNYRSYQKILDASAKFIPEGYELPHSAASLMEHQPTMKDYVVYTDNVENPRNAWFKEIGDLIAWAKQENTIAEKFHDESRRINNIAVFFRKNSEVYHGYSQIKSIVPNDVRIRIQGANTCDLWREREIYDIIRITTVRRNLATVKVDHHSRFYC